MIARRSMTRLPVRTAAGLAALLLAGCGGGAGSLAPGGESTSNKLASILAFGTPNMPPAPAIADPNAIKLICPTIDVPDGAAALRVGGQNGTSVRYQYSLGETARECVLNGGQISIRVGIEGRVLIGPAGSAGSFSVPVRVAIQRVADLKFEVSRVYKVAASVAPGETQGSFQLVTDPIVVPYKHEDATDDYNIIVGFDSGRTAATPQRRRRH